MYKEKERIIAIVNELIAFLLNNNASSIYITIKESDNENKIIVCCNVLDIRILDEVKDKIISKRNREIEELYWELLGETSSKNELYLLGNMIDESSLDTLDSNMVKITLIRKKDNTK
ncbi:hypothetical protein [Caldisalinibacter kiritimatiensis]|uniref:Na+-translocating membrane potential-generating system MpsC domain-containing protein n=1 Tax=Caldisalinibacter kiritimatiensis TaxID=1304284 RepID=R1AYS4_9FIRM|nr:hypothetical protein [Caldisalinibacter kiritimatiensis]EOD01862.1 hypothetical protein L21TH_0048 [Caldisalinibacter kiritimatiensis]